MNQVLEVRKTPDRKVFAKRKDGQSLTVQDREEAKKLAQELRPPCWNCGETMTEAKDIYGKEWWACWHCAKWA